MSAANPLSGVTVVEIGTSVAAPFGSWILGYLGARVIKIESARGDDARQWGRMLPDGRSSFFEALNANKESVVLDLRDDKDKHWLKEFCETKADVVIQNMRPGKVAQLGLDGAELSLTNPKLIYFNLGAFGAVGPKASAPGYDPLMQAAGGIMSVTGEPDRPPVRVGVSIVDMGSGMWAAIGVLAALYQRTSTGRGAIIDGSLYETAVAWVANQSAMVQVDGRNPEKVGSGARGMAPYQAYDCADGYLVVSAPNDNLFERLCKALGFLDLLGDPRFATNQLRYANLTDLNRFLEPVLKTQTRDHWMDVLDKAGVPCAPVRQITEMLADEQTRALGIVQSLEQATPELIGLPLSFDGERPALRTMPPALGEHTELVKGG
ncbi:CoA transferase [Ruegeria sp. HKCCD4884]|uniref:CaiB/BaiF CoA transferase family protein n=1 Tax=Ruegeria sp. HKCCD4884 TaxID=2683022 RepID=UPI001492665B|nr:CoA transferase [Ruegeria sp. HKCCD4884]NOD95289.1 CoA transferase [Ruegeria sp. HKCCD4884]